MTFRSWTAAENLSVNVEEMSLSPLAAAPSTEGDEIT